MCAAVLSRADIAIPIAALFLLLLITFWPHSILEPFGICWGGWRGFRRCDKAGLSGLYGPSVGLIMSPRDLLVARPYGPALRAWLM